MVGTYQLFREERSAIEPTLVKYYWGFFVYWGALALAYSALRVSGIEL